MKILRTTLPPTSTTPSRLRTPDIQIESVFSAQDWDARSLHVHHFIKNCFEKDGKPIDLDKETSTIHLPLGLTFSETAASYFNIPVSGHVTGPKGMRFNSPSFVLTTGPNRTYGHIEQGCAGQVTIQISGRKVWFIWLAGSDITGIPDFIVYTTTGTFLAIPGGAYHIVVSLGNCALLGGLVNYPHNHQAWLLRETFHEL